MALINPTYLGIETSGNLKPFTCAVFTRNGKLAALKNVDRDELIDIAANNPESVAAVNSPFSPNRGLVRQGEVRKLLKPLHFSGRNQDMRLAEYKLKEIGINVLMTPAKRDLCSNWIQSGFTIYEKLSELGFEKYPRDSSTRLMLETHSNASFIALSSSQLLPKLSIEGRIQRQLILFEEGLSINDPMEFFEEVTRHKLLRGIMPTELIYTPEELDAMMAGLVAFRVGESSAELTSIGDPAEGQIVLPVGSLLEKY